MYLFTFRYLSEAYEKKKLNIHAFTMMSKKYKITYLFFIILQSINLKQEQSMIRGCLTF